MKYLLAGAAALAMLGAGAAQAHGYGHQRTVVRTVTTYRVITDRVVYRGASHHRRHAIHYRYAPRRAHYYPVYYPVYVPRHHHRYRHYDSGVTIAFAYGPRWDRDRYYDGGYRRHWRDRDDYGGYRHHWRDRDDDGRWGHRW